MAIVTPNNPMFYPRLSGDRYINPLTDFGFKRLFGTEPNKRLLIDFLNVILPTQHRVKDLTYRSSENLGNTPLDRKAVFDLYCQSEKGEKFIVEMQKAKHNYFKDRSIYYASFPIQDQAEKGDWNYKLDPVYTIGILDFVFDEDKNDDTLFEVARITNFSPAEREAYESSLKYYRDMNGVIETAREEGKAQGVQEGKSSLLLKLLSRKLDAIPDEIKVLLHGLAPEQLDSLSEALFDLENLEDLSNWLENIND